MHSLATQDGLPSPAKIEQREDLVLLRTILYLLFNTYTCSNMSIQKHLHSRSQSWQARAIRLGVNKHYCITIS